MQRIIVGRIVGFMFAALLVTTTEGWAAETEQEAFVRIRTLINEKKIVEASEALNAALTDNPSAFNLQQLRPTVAIYLSRDQRAEDAAQHMDRYVEFIV